MESVRRVVFKHTNGTIILWFRPSYAVISFLLKKERNCNLQFVIYWCWLFITFCLQDDLIKILGEKHQLNEFLNVLYVKCSYLLFNKEHTTAILSEIIRYNSAENDQRIQSCMNILVVRSRPFGCIDLLPLVLGHLYYAFSVMILEQFLLLFIQTGQGKVHKRVYIFACTDNAAAD